MVQLTKYFNILRTSWPWFYKLKSWMGTGQEWGFGYYCSWGIHLGYLAKPKRVYNNCIFGFFWLFHNTVNGYISLLVNSLRFFNRTPVRSIKYILRFFEVCLKNDMLDLGLLQTIVLQIEGTVTCTKKANPKIKFFKPKASSKPNTNYN